MGVLTFIFYLFFLLIFVVLAVYAERKTAAFIQNRLGPMVVGPYGIFQTLADLLKMLQKEDIRANAVDLMPFLVAPIIVFTAVFGGFSLLPLKLRCRWVISFKWVVFIVGNYFIGRSRILMAGWASNNKYSLFGAMRAVAQIISYEIPLGLSILCVVIFAGTLDLQAISVRQLGNGLLDWNIIKYPVLIVPFVIFFISGLAESNRTPFDLPESESELIGGFHTEYSGFRWGIFMLAEYGMMLLMSILGVVLFFGGWNSPFPTMGLGVLWESFWLLSKALLLVFIQLWIRWTFPRLRVDQLMALSWKYLTPISILMLFLCGIWKLYLIS